MSKPNPPPTPDNRPDAQAFFRARLDSLPQVPSGRTDPDVDAFEMAYGKNTGYTREELVEIVKRVRAETRKARANLPKNEESPMEEPRGWARWIMGVGIGIYILAALGLVFYAASIKGLGWQWTELQPYIVGIIVVGIVLLILSYGWRVLKETDLSDKTKRIFGTIILGFCTIIAAAAVVWICFVIFQLASLKPPDGSSKRGLDDFKRPSSLGWHSGLFPVQYRTKPEFTGIPYAIDEIQQMPPYLSITDYEKVREQQTHNKEGENPPFYYLFATRTFQEYELLPKQIGLRDGLKAEIVVYIQEFVDGWLSYRSQDRIVPAKQFIELPDRSKERRKRVVVVVIFPFDLSSFRKKLDENHGSIDGLIEVRFEP